MTKKVTKESNYEVTDPAANKVAMTAAEIAELPKVLGGRGFCSDSTHTTLSALVEGGGNNFVPVYCDGTVWRVG